MTGTDPRSDDVLIEAAREGDATAFESLYDRYRDWVVRLAMRFTGNRADALDVLQETFAYVWRKLPGLRLSARMTTFLYPAVKHLSISARRRRTISDEALDRVPAPDPPEGRLDDLAAVVGILPDRQREVLLMRFVDGMSLADIAAALDIPLGTVKSRLHHALATLRRDARTRRYFS